ncbi:MAG: HAD-IIIA family hydrolase [Lentisphaerae bacterium]|nr:HAD-IIIA family hydrolase [Lentisphaerota bacterium]
MDWSTKAQEIRAVMLDVDGVLTDCRIGYGCGSDEEIKFFHIRDGVGIALLRHSGIKVGIITGRRCKANRKRAEELKMDFIMEGVVRKRDALLALCEQFGLQPANCLYVGDDLVDLGPMRLAGIAVAVGDAAPEIKAVATWVTSAPGGRGAVREVAEWLLKAQGRWDQLIVEIYGG